MTEPRQLLVPRHRALPQLLGIGLALSLGGALLGVALLRLLPFELALALGSMATLALGIALALRLGAASLFVLGLLGLIGTAGAVVDAQRWLALLDAPEATLPSIEAAATVPDALRLRFPEATPRFDLIGEARSQIPRSAGPPTTLAALAVPLVPLGWTRERPVPAWLVCDHTLPSPPCTQPMPPRVTQAFRTAPHPEAAQSAIARHGLTSAPNAAWLTPSTDLSADTAQAAWMLPVWPLGTWLLWVLALLVFRVLPRARPLQEPSPP